MSQAVGYECDICKKLTKDIVTVSIDSDKHKFKFDTQVDQPHLVLSLCLECLPAVGKVVSDAICG